MTVVVEMNETNLSPSNNAQGWSLCEGTSHYVTCSGPFWKSENPSFSHKFNKICHHPLNSSSTHFKSQTPSLVPKISMGLKSLRGAFLLFFPSIHLLIPFLHPSMNLPFLSSNSSPLFSHPSFQHPPNDHFSHRPPKNHSHPPISHPTNTPMTNNRFVAGLSKATINID